MTKVYEAPSVRFSLDFTGVLTATGRPEGDFGRLELEPSFETDLLDLRIVHRKRDPRIVIGTGVRLNREEAAQIAEQLFRWSRTR